MLPDGHGVRAASLQPAPTITATALAAEGRNLLRAPFCAGKAVAAFAAPQRDAKRRRTSNSMEGRIPRGKDFRDRARVVAGWRAKGAMR